MSRGIGALFAALGGARTMRAAGVDEWKLAGDELAWAQDGRRIIGIVTWRPGLFWGGTYEVRAVRLPADKRAAAAEAYRLAAAALVPGGLTTPYHARNLSAPEALAVSTPAHPTRG